MDILKDYKFPNNLFDFKGKYIDGWNGNIGDVDYSNPQSFVPDKFKVAYAGSDKSKYSAAVNIAYQIALLNKAEANALADPDTPYAVGSDEEEKHLNAVDDAKKKLTDALPNVKDDIVRVIATFSLYNALHAADWKYEVRASDLVNFEPNTRLLTFAQAVHDHVSKDPKFMAAVAGMVNIMNTAMVANAIHRKSTKKAHNWFSKSEITSPTVNRALSIGGAQKEELKVFMNTYGHDWNHHLSDKALSNAADIITCDDKTTGVFKQSTTYMGDDVEGKQYSQVMAISDSVMDRWPAGMLGKAALITGTEAIMIMLAHIGQKIVLTKTQGLATNLGAFLATMKARDMDRKTLTKVNSGMEHIISVAYGYCVELALVDSAKMIALKNHAGRVSHAKASGESLARLVNTTATHPEAIAAAIESTLAATAAGLESVAKILQGAAIPFTPATMPDITAEVKSDTTMKDMLAIASTFVGKSAGSPAP